MSSFKRKSTFFLCASLGSSSGPVLFLSRSVCVLVCSVCVGVGVCVCVLTEEEGEKEANLSSCRLETPSSGPC